MSPPPDSFEAHRGHLVGVAYRMLGSVSEAEDVVQDAWLRWRNTDSASVEHPRGFLSTVVTRLCLDRLKEARRSREQYVGAWLPEPWVDTTDPAPGVAHDLSVALLLALERLSPLERAAFLLHDVFDVEFSEIALALGRSEAACRQLASRARAHAQAARPRFDVDADEQERVAAAFFDAWRTGDVQALIGTLADDVVLRQDGGGRRVAALRPLEGHDRVSRFFAGLIRKWGRPSRPGARRLVINGQPGLLCRDHAGVLQTLTLTVAAGGVRAIYVTRNPDKLGHVATLAPGGEPAEHD